MCIVCEIKRRGQQIHEEILAGLQSEQDDVEIAMAKAQVTRDNAEAVSKLVEAAQNLFDMGEVQHGQRVLLALDDILPQPRTGQTAEPSAQKESGLSPEANGQAEPVDEFEGLPPFLKDYVLNMRKAGIDIEVQRFSL